MKKPLILCVDDQKEILDSLEDQITRRMGDEFDVELAESGEEGLELIEDVIEEGEQKIALIISDHLMPGMKGDEFLIAAHKVLPQTSKIMLTGQASLDAVRNVINNARLYRYVEKPWDEHDLLLTLEEATRSYMQYMQLIEYNRLLRLLNSATQELSREIRIQSLLEKIMQSALDSTDAEQGYLVFDQDGESNIHSVASAINDSASSMRLRQINEDPDLTNQVLRNVQMTIAEQKDHDYRLATPINKAGKHIGYVYVENPVTRAFFNKIQKEIMLLLSVQAAISIENANLYESLEEKTNELEEEKVALADANQLIEQKSRDITDSIRYARRIQEAIMPDITFLKVAFPESFALYMPKDIVSGDFYWWLERDEKFMIAAVDCTGHGVPGAFMSVIASNFLGQIGNDRAISDPGEALQSLNLRTRTALKLDEQDDSQDGMDLSLCMVDREKKQLKFAGAALPLYFIREGELMNLKGHKISIGDTLQDGTLAEYEAETIDLQYGDTFYLFTDGLQDQFGGPNFKKYNPRRFRELLLKIQPLSMEEQEKAIVEEVNAWRGEEELTDDIMVIGVRYTETEFK